LERIALSMPVERQRGAEWSWPGKWQSISLQVDWSGSHLPRLAPIRLSGVLSGGQDCRLRL